MNRISGPGAKGSETPGATLMYVAFIHRSICQEAKAEREHADHEFISAGLCLKVFRGTVDILPVLNK